MTQGADRLRQNGLLCFFISRHAVICFLWFILWFLVKLNLFLYKYCGRID